MASMAEFMVCMSAVPLSAAGAGLLGEVVGFLGVLGVALGHAGHFFEGRTGFFQRGGLFARTFGQ